MSNYQFHIVNADTDSIMFAKPNGDPFSEEEQARLLLELNSLYPERIRFEHDGVFDTVIVVASKNYVLCANGKIKLKGSSLIDQKKEPALSEMLNVMIRDIIYEQGTNIPEIYKRYVKEAMNIRDINRWCVKKTITKAVLNGDDPEARLNESKVLDAMNESVRRGVIEQYNEGDKIWLYNSIDGEIQKREKGELVFYKDGRPKMIPNNILRVKELWNGDEDKMHYIGRVYKTAEILSNVIDMNQITDYTKKKNVDKLRELTYE